MGYTTRKADGTEVTLSAQEKDGLLQILSSAWEIAATEKWQKIWQENYEAQIQVTYGKVTLPKLPCAAYLTCSRLSVGANGGRLGEAQKTDR